jgi:hypothetical protein
MITKTSNVLMITEVDIRQLVHEWIIIPEWIKAHVSAKCPAHRYEGELVLDEEKLTFRGRDIKVGRDFVLEIPLNDILNVSLSFSEYLKSSANPAFGIGGPVPFAVQYRDNGSSQTVYFNTSFNNYLAHGDKTNRKWYEVLDKTVLKRKISNSSHRCNRVLVLASK